MRQEVEAIVRHAGAKLMSYYRQPLKRITKGSSFTTEADLVVEQFLVSQLHELMPQASFNTEESGLIGDTTSPYCWVIDPLDGTTNFVQGLPYFCISVALTYRDKPILGVVYQPLLDDFFYAGHNEGAWLNDQSLQLIAAKNDHKKAILGGGASHRFKKYGYTTRYFGAIALDCAYVACGLLDGIIMTACAWWDIAAGLLLILEAGGTITGALGEPITKQCSLIVAGATSLHEDLIKRLNEANS